MCENCPPNLPDGPRESKVELRVLPGVPWGGAEKGDVLKEIPFRPAGVDDRTSFYILHPSMFIRRGILCMGREAHTWGMEVG